METMPSVSVIMNCHNGSQYLREAIESVYDQTYQNWEIIFWDNVSTDDSAIIALSYDSRIKYYFAEEKTSLGEARNLALEKVTGKYVCFLDCDDLYFPNKLEKQVEMMEAEDFPLSYGSALIIDENSNKIKKFLTKNNSGYIFDNLLNFYEINMQSVILRHSFLVKEDLSFLTSLQYNPDYNLFMQIASYNQIGVEQDCIVKYRVLKNSLSSKTMNLVGSEARLTLDRIIEISPELESRFKKAFEQAYGKSVYYDAIAAIKDSDYKTARQLLRSIFSLRYEYLGLYLILLFPLSRKLILNFLNRYI